MAALQAANSLSSTLVVSIWMCEALLGGGGGGEHMSQYSSEFQNPLFQGLRKRLCPCWYFYNQLLLYFPLLLAMSQSQPILMSFVNISSVLRCYFKVISPQIFSPTGTHFCNIYIYLIFKMGKWPISLTNMIIVAISLFSLNIFLNCFIGPMRKQVL